jgi:hypothetical protein
MNQDIHEIEQEMKKVAIPLSEFNVDDESKNALKNHERFAENFFKNIVDYSKWITTISLAAFLLIGAIFRDEEGVSNPFYLAAIILIFLSIIISIGIFYCVLKFWRREYDYYFDLSVYYSMLWALKNNLTLSSNSDCEKQKDDMLEKRAGSTLFSMPGLYFVLMILQIIFLFIGILCYIIGVNIQ